MEASFLFDGHILITDLLLQYFRNCGAAKMFNLEEKKVSPSLPQKSSLEIRCQSFVFTDEVVPTLDGGDDVWVEV